MPTNYNGAQWLRHQSVRSMPPPADERRWAALLRKTGGSSSGIGTTANFWFDGLRIDPDVSVPTLAAQKLAVGADARARAAGRQHRTAVERGIARIAPRIVRVEAVARRARCSWPASASARGTQFASSVSRVFAMMIAPASRRFFVERRLVGRHQPSNASAPPVVGMSVVWMLSLSATGNAVERPRIVPRARSRSSASASSSAWGSP